MDSYHLSCLCERRVPELRLAGRASNLPLPLRAARISSTCHAASLDSPQALKSVLRQVLPVAVEVEWLHRYCVFLAKQHGMAALLGAHLIQTAGTSTVSLSATQRQTHRRDAGMQKWRGVVQRCAERRQQQRQHRTWARLPQVPQVQRHDSAGARAGAGLPAPARRGYSEPEEGAALRCDYSAPSRIF